MYKRQTLDNNTSDNTISGNYIGVTTNGVLPLGNGNHGVFLASNSNDNIIGYDPSMIESDPLIVGNRIRHNTDSGIVLAANNAQRNRISRNSIGFNGGLGIDLHGDGVSSNDNGDPDFGSNSLLNFPVFTRVSFAADSTLTVRGFAPSGTTLEFFIADGEENPMPLPAAYTTSFGEGLTYIGSATEGGPTDLSPAFGIYNNDGTGNIFNRNQNTFEFVFDVSGLSIISGSRITATATDSGGNTSEFSGAFEMSDAGCGVATMNPHIMWRGGGN